MSGKEKSLFGFRSGTEASERITAYLRKRFPIKTVDSIAADTGLSSNTVRKWFSRESTPSAAAVFALIGAYGPEFLCAALNKAPAWLDAAAQHERLAALGRQLTALQQDLEAFK